MEKKHGEPEEWLTKADALRYMGYRSPRQLERCIARGEVHKRVLDYEPGSKAPTVVVAKADLDALKDRLAKGIRVPEAPTPANPESSTAVAVRDGGAPPLRVQDGFAALLAKLAPVEAPRPWLTLPEAADYSGLPARWLRHAAELGNVEAINVGSELRHVWRFRRDALAGALTTKLAKHA